VSEIYLDYNASAPVRPEVSEAVRDALDARYGNPSSIHRPGHRAKVLLEKARRSVAELVGAEPEDIVFTSGGTESNNLALYGVALAHGAGHLIVTALEHSSVLEPALDLERRGYRLSRIPPDSQGCVAPEAILCELTGGTFLISLMHSNHEVGTLQEVRLVSEGLRGHPSLLHCDAVQSLGKVPLSVRVLGADLVSLSSHKIGGPAGVGALWIRPEARLEPLLRGGGQETNRRAGTQALSLIAGFGVAARMAREEADSEEVRLGCLRDRLEERLVEAFPSVRFHGRARARLPGTSNFALPGFRGEELVTALDLEGVAVSTGSACAVGTLRPSHVLQAMGCPPEEAEASLRVSFGYRSREADVDLFLAALARIAARRGRTIRKTTRLDPDAPVTTGPHVGEGRR